MMSKDDYVAVLGTRRKLREMADGTVRVEIDIEPNHKKMFLELFPDIDTPVVIGKIQDSVAIEEGREKGVSGGQTVSPQEPAQVTNGQVQKRPPNELARKMHVNGYFFNRDLWVAMHDKGIWTLQDHKMWIELLGCVFVQDWNPSAGPKPSKVIPKIRVNINTLSNAKLLRCNGQIVAHHCVVANVKAAGKQRQPENPNKIPHWFTIPVCHAHHDWCHSKEPSRVDKHDLHNYAIELTAYAIKDAMKVHLGIESLAEITEDQLFVFERELGIG